MGTQSSSPGQIISLPKGGGALSGIGEKFSPDLHTGTGNFTVPVNLPSGRNGFQPELNLLYSTGHGNGSFGLGWSLNIPGVTRKTSAGVPLFHDNFFDNNSDVFILSGAEDLVPVALWRYDPNDQDRIIPVDIPESQDWSNAPVVQFRPRTEGLFARILYYRKDTNIRWTVESKDGLKSIYGSSSQDSSHGIISKPGNPSHVFAWKLTETKDPFGNKIRYEYEKDSAGGNQLYLKSVKYVDYGDPSEKFLVHVNFEYEERPDPFSDYRSGFEIRTTRRCKAIRVTTNTDDGNSHPVREYKFSYLADPYSGVSLLQQLDITGFDDDGNPYSDDSDGRYPRQLPPLTFGYTSFAPETRRFKVVEGNDLPALTPDMELVDLHGSGLPDILEMNGTVRFWRNLGNGRFDMPRLFRYAPYHALSDPGVQMIDANGDGRIDLLVTSGPLAGYYPMEHGGKWSEKSFQRYTHSPGFNLDDPEVKLVDVNGDGYTDILRSGSRLECFFNDPDPSLAWKRTNFANRQSIESFPNVNFSDPRVRLADMTGDGLQDIVLIHDGNVEYWPNLGHNRWGKRVSMQYAPRFNDPWHTAGYDPKRLLLGDVVGDGLADMIYVDHDRVKLWINQSGNGWSKDPVIIRGTPPTTGMDHVRLIDLYGTGVSGVLWSSDELGIHRRKMMYLDFTGGVKPCVMNGMDNHMGAITRVEYKPSTWYFLKDQQNPATRWRTPLPFPVQVVFRVEVVDKISKGKKSTEYKYHHGYWDGAEREFRGFGMVEQLDTESFDIYHTPGLHGDTGSFIPVAEEQFSSPKLTRSWFHQGPVGEEYGDWEETDYTHEYWPDDPQIMEHREQVSKFLGKYNDRGSGVMPSPKNRRIKRDALRTLRGSILRTELYALDGSERQNRPYTVTEHAYDLKEIDAPVGASGRKRIFFTHLVAQRTTQWERGEDPMTQFAFTGDYDDFGQPRRQSAIAMPRLRRHQQTITGEVVGTIQPNETRVLATHSRTGYVIPPNDNPYIHDRVAQARTYELESPPPGPDAVNDTIGQVLRKQHSEAVRIDALFNDPANVSLIGHQRLYYDGLTAVGQIGAHGALSRSEALAFTDALLQTAYGNERRPAYLGGAATLPSNAPANFGAAIGYRQETEGYYAETMRQQLSPRGLPLVLWDAMGHETAVTYDGYHLLPIQVTDAKDLTITAEYNMRLLQPARMTEPNGNSTCVIYNPIGLPERQYIVGMDAQGNEALGGTAVTAELSFAYNFLHYRRNRDEDDKNIPPIYVHTYRRILHRSTLLAGEKARRAEQGLSALSDTDLAAYFPSNLADEVQQYPERFIQSREYSDGFGRLIQTRAQAEDYVFGELGGEVGLPDQPGNAPTTAVARQQADSVVVSGWERFDNKGQVIARYEPFFSTGWGFQGEAEAVRGQHATLFYDPRGQVIRTLNPDGSQQHVIFGRPLQPDQLTLGPAGLTSLDVPDGFVPTPWENYTYDANDLAPRSQIVLPDGTNLSLEDRAHKDHHFTPASVVLDGMGRALCAVARNDRSSDKWHITRSTYDIRGNLMTVIDTLGRTAFSYQYDLLDRSLCVDSIDAGRRTSVFDAPGNLIDYRDSKGSLALRTYDELNRPKELWARNDSASDFTLRERVHYGDEGAHALARQHNTLGQPVAHYDEAGLLAMPEYDFKGNLLEKSRRTIADQVLANGWQADWSATDAVDALEDTTYQTSSRYDGLNRPTEVTYPQDVDGQRKQLIPRYNRAGALEAVRLGDDEYVQQIAYNAKGQRVLIAYGNGIMTRHAYDEQTFHLSRLRTERFTHTEDGTAGTRTWGGSGQLLQDFTYGYDLAGNITAIDERVDNCGIAGSALGRDRLLREFTYDPIYRLLSATGRADENIGQPGPFADDPRAGFYAGGAPAHNQNNAPDLTEGYTGTFEYDPAGNMFRLHYQATSGQWARRFGMAGQAPDQWADANSNRLTSLVNGSVASNCQFDPNGNLIRQNTEKHHTWDHADRMVGFRVQPEGSSSASIQARYLYGADGMRVKKWVSNQQGQVNASTYIDGIFEMHRFTSASEDNSNNTLHVMDDQSRIAMVRVGQALDDRDASPQVQYHLGDHLGSSHVVVGGDGVTAHAFINREEYFPYGETSFGSFGRKRYRYSGKERDEESGLYYYGARYLAPWMSRWVSCDPAGMVDGENIYIYVLNNPLNFRDPLGFLADNPIDHLHEGPPVVSAVEDFPNEFQNLKFPPEIPKNQSPPGKVEASAEFGYFKEGASAKGSLGYSLQLNDPIMDSVALMVSGAVGYDPNVATNWKIVKTIQLQEKTKSQLSANVGGKVQPDKFVLDLKLQAEFKRQFGSVGGFQPEAGVDVAPKLRLSTDTNMFLNPIFAGEAGVFFKLGSKLPIPGPFIQGKAKAEISNYDGITLDGSVRVDGGWEGTMGNFFIFGEGKLSNSGKSSFTLGVGGRLQ